MNRYIWIGLVLFLISCCGCLGAFQSAQSPRPKEYQVDAAEKITTTSVTEVMKGQIGKQTGIEKIATEAIKAIKDSKTKAQAEAITNVVANAANEIRQSDGSAKLLATMSGSANKSLTEMNAMEYLGYVQGQTALAQVNREKLAKGIDLGLDATQKIAGTALGGTGLGGLIALGIGMIRRGRDRKNKGELLKAVGNSVNDLETEHPDAAKALKSMIAKKASVLPVNADKEFAL